jgi:LysM repeat protein/uncharacterized protein YvpB
MAFRTFFRIFSIVLILSLFAFQSSPGNVKADSLPPEAYISGVSGQPQKYGLDCEVRSAVDWAKFFGVNITEDQFLARLPRSDNPDEGFVGDPNGRWGMIPPNSYGVHAAPIARVLQGYGLKAQARSGMTLDELRSELAAGRPVIVWVIGLVWRGTPVPYTSRSGAVTTVAAYEHSMMAVGYTSTLIHLLDSASGGTQPYSLNNFLTSWQVLGNMAVIAEGPPPTPYSGSSTQTASGTYVVQRGDYLAGIANRYNINWVTLAALNNISYPYVIYAGQVLRLPGGETQQPTLTSTSAIIATTVSTPTSQSVTATPATLAPTSTPVVSPPTATPSPVNSTYIVQRGDYLSSIARRFNTTWQELAQINHLYYPYIIYAGQTLELPASAAAPTAIPKSAETSTATATSQLDITPAPQTPTLTPTVTPTVSTYIVQRGDYLVALAQRFGTDWRTLARLNGIYYPYTIYPGQVLRLP